MAAFSKIYKFRLNLSLKFAPKGSINNIPAQVQIMAWRRSGDKPLSEPMIVSLLTHICVTRPRLDNFSRVITTNVCTWQCSCRVIPERLLRVVGRNSVRTMQSLH